MGYSKTLAEIAARVSRMSWPELRTRGEQEIAKLWDLANYRMGVGQGTATVARHAQGPEPQFFFAPDDLPAIVEFLRRELPAEAERIVGTAERICRHEFDLLGYENLRFGDAIDWHRDIVNEKSAPRRPWFQIPFLDFDAVGDHKVIWELNRHQHLVTLAKAYLITGNEAFARELFAQWYDWRAQNPYPIGVNWASSLEVAFRVMSWLWVSHLLRGQAVVPANFDGDLEAALAQSGRHIRRYLSTFFAPNTHLLGEGVALFYLGTLCPALPAAACWREEGWRIVLAQAGRQVETDGFHFEHSTYYHVYALDFFMHARILAARNGVAIPSELDRTLEAMLDILAQLGQGGVPPRFGDDDGGRLFDGRRNHTAQLLDPLTTGAALFERAAWKAVAPDPSEETLWLLGPDAARRLREMPAIRGMPTSRRFPTCGIHMMMLEDWQLTIDGGPQGVYGHTHADALSLQLSRGSQEWLVDPGTCSYMLTAERETFRGTSAHNTLTIDGRSQAQPRGPFSWGQLPEVHTEHWIRGESFELFVGSHNGYDPVRHRRWVLRGPGFWLVRDLALGTGEHQLEVFWHFAPDLRITEAEGVLARRGREGLALLEASPDWRRHIEEAAWSPAYGRKQPAPVVRFESRAVLTTSAPTQSLAVLLVPFISDPPPANFSEWARSERITAWRFGDHVMFVADQEGEWQAGAWSSDARVLLAGWTPDGALSYLALACGSRVTYDGQVLVTSQQVMERLEWRRNGPDAGSAFHEEALRRTRRP